MESGYQQSTGSTDIAGRVLVVDDDKVIRTLHRTLLSTHFDVETVSSGEEALRICQQRLPDLVLLDVSMPDMDGYETCRRLRDITEIPIIFATANESLDEHLKAFDAGGNDLITKPIVKEILLRKIALAIQHKNEKKNLKTEKDSLQSMAMSFLSAAGESGILQQFMQSSLTCGTPHELGERLIHAISNFGLEGSVLIRDSSHPTVLKTHDEPSEIEKSILEHANSMGRIFQFKQKLMVSYDRVSVIINNIPIDDLDKAGRIRDNITMLTEMTDTLCDNVSMRQTSHARAEQLQVAMTTAFVAIQSLHEVSQNMQRDSRLLLQELVDNVEKTYAWLGTGRDQEEKISLTMQGSIEKILSLLENTRELSNKKFDEVRATLGGSGDVELF